MHSIRSRCAARAGGRVLVSRRERVAAKQVFLGVGGGQAALGHAVELAGSNGALRLSVGLVGRWQW